MSQAKPKEEEENPPQRRRPEVTGKPKTCSRRLALPASILLRPPLLRLRRRLDRRLQPLRHRRNRLRPYQRSVPRRREGRTRLALSSVPTSCSSRRRRRSPRPLSDRSEEQRRRRISFDLFARSTLCRFVWFLSLVSDSAFRGQRDTLWESILEIARRERGTDLYSERNNGSGCVAKTSVTGGKKNICNMPGGLD